ncbi:MAG: 16S rRNA (guanine(527)-N(7))-methyltransferase RsmG, partial [Rhodospirillaceae bacterium]
MSAGEMQRITGVSHETLGRLEAYLDLLVRWQRRINLVGPKT